MVKAVECKNNSDIFNQLKMGCDSKKNSAVLIMVNIMSIVLFVIN